MKLSFTLLLFTQVAGVAANEEEFSHRKLRGLLGFNKNVVVSFKEECDDIEGDVSKAGADRLLDFISLKLKTAVLRPMAASLLKKLVDSDCVESFEEVRRENRQHD